jgi:hypothetical protein
VAAESTWDVRAVKVRLPSELVGEAAARSLAGDALPSPRGTQSAASPPAGFPAAPLSGQKGVIRGKAPFGATHKGKCSCATPVGALERERVAIVFGTKSFVATAAEAKATLLRVRARYRDGLVVWLNGERLVRSALSSSRRPLAGAWRPRGPEWESFHVSVTPGTLKEGANLLAFEVRPSDVKMAPKIDLELQALDGPPQVVRGPMLQKVTGANATILFETDVPTDAAVEYWSQDGKRARISSARGALATRHEVDITGLKPSQAINYRLVVAGAPQAEHSFHSAPAPGVPIRFALYGDMRGGHGTHARIVKSIAKEAPDFVVLTGDLVLRGSDGGDWQRFFNVAAELLSRVAYYPAAGNHDMGKSGVERRRMKELFALFAGPDSRPAWGQWYSFDIADIHFIMLDSNAYEAKEQLDWLDEELRHIAKKKPRATFVLTHDGPYSRGLHRGNPFAAQHYAPKLAAANVTYLFSGHDHLYQRGRAGGLDYIVSGGGGAPLYSVRCGVKGKRKCKVDDGMVEVESEHHYVMISVFAKHVQVCPKRSDGTALKRCSKKRLP